jgi:hypothetical protein
MPRGGSGGSSSGGSRGGSSGNSGGYGNYGGPGAFHCPCTASYGGPHSSITNCQLAK